MTLRALHLLQ